MYAIRFTNGNQVKYLIYTQGDTRYNALDSGTVAGARTWKTERGAKKYLEQHLLIGGQGERLRAKWSSIEVVEISSQQQWDKQHPDIVKQSKAKYDQRRPVLSFRPKPEIAQWLTKERCPNETDAELLNRKLDKLRQLECQGY
jgi:hypothetical protein